MTRKQLSLEAKRRWREFQKRAAIPLQHVAPDLIDRALQSEKHFGIRIAPWVTADLCLTTNGVKVRTLSNDPKAIDLFEYCELKQHEIETAIGMQIPSGNWSNTGAKQRSFSTPDMGRGDLTVITTREDAEHDWFIEMVLRLSRVMKKLVEEFKQNDKDTTL